MYQEKSGNPATFYVNKKLTKHVFRQNEVSQATIITFGGLQENNHRNQSSLIQEN
jgi:hypothetical protein